jgi:predicted HAD superfamily Cof-like phosphohydrolase
MRKQIDSLIEFQKTFGSPVLNKPEIPNKERCELRHKLLLEEVNELKEASDDNDIVAVADAITDCLYILLGTACEYGIQNYIEDCFDEVHSSNMSKLDENGNVLYREDGKILKSNLYRKPNLNKIVCQ